MTGLLRSAARRLAPGRLYKLLRKKTATTRGRELLVELALDVVSAMMETAIATEKLACGDACLRSRELASGLRSVMEPTVCRLTRPSRYLLSSSSTRTVRFAGFRLNLSGQADSSPRLTGSKYDCSTRLGIREGLVVVQSQPQVATDDGKTSWVDTPGVAGQLHRADVG